MPRLAFVGLALVGSVPAVVAGVYSPDDPCPFAVKPDGTAEPLPFKLFQILTVEAPAGLLPVDPLNPGTFDWYRAEDGRTWRVGAAGVMSQRLAARWPRRDELTGPDLAGYTADLLRLGGTVQAIQRLQPELRSRRPNYLLLANLAHAYAAAGDWDTALVRFTDVLDCDPPVALPGTPADRLAWQAGVDRKFYRQWLRVRKDEAAKKIPVEKQEPDAVFLAPDGRPIRFWESDAEAAKLPPDALAVAQQLSLWAPWDVKLLWLVAEVYLARGQVREADAIFYICSNAKKFGGPTLFRDHAARARDAVAALPPPSEAPVAVPDDGSAPPRPADGEQGLFALVDRTTFYVVVGVFAAAAVAMLALQVRSLRKRLLRGRK